jgi:hypothetical protein
MDAQVLDIKLLPKDATAAYLDADSPTGAAILSDCIHHYTNGQTMSVTAIWNMKTPLPLRMTEPELKISALPTLYKPGAIAHTYAR